MKKITEMLLKYIFWLGIILIILPFGISLLMNRKEVLFLQKNAVLEDYLPVMVYQQINSDYEPEAVKAQIIIARTNASDMDWMEEKEYESAIWLLRERTEDLHFLKKIREIKKLVAETESRKIYYQGKLCRIPYFKISGGKTRNGAQVFMDDDYCYIKSVESSQDRKAKEYLHSYYFTRQELFYALTKKYPDCKLAPDYTLEQLFILQRDEGDYALTMNIGAIVVPAEEVRELLGLSSSNFVIQQIKEEIRFLCRGVGHGVGLSQFGANELAKEGFTCEEILKYYFPDVYIE